MEFDLLLISFNLETLNGLVSTWNSRNFWSNSYHIPLSFISFSIYNCYCNYFSVIFPKNYSFFTNIILYNNREENGIMIKNRNRKSFCFQFITKDVSLALLLSTFIISVLSVISRRKFLLYTSDKFLDIIFLRWTTSRLI